MSELLLGLTAVLAILKYTGVITISWLLVLSPILIGLGFVLLCIIAQMIIEILAWRDK